MQPAPLAGTATVAILDSIEEILDATRTPYGDGNALLRMVLMLPMVDATRTPYGDGNLICELLLLEFKPDAARAPCGDGNLRNNRRNRNETLRCSPRPLRGRQP